MRNVPAIDATEHPRQSARSFTAAARTGSTLILSGVHTQPLFALQRCGLWDEIGEENMFGNIDDALNHARRILGLPEEPRPEPFVPVVARERQE